MYDLCLNKWRIEFKSLQNKLFLGYPKAETCVYILSHQNFFDAESEHKVKNLLKVLNI